jgi:Kdo2-lipid IVA lauroyltransferase/acyltransferase
MGSSPFRRRLRRNLRRILWHVGRFIAPLFLYVLGRLPRETLHGMAEGAGAFWFRFIGSSRQLGMDNLDLVFGDALTREEKAECCRESFKNILMCMMDYYHFSFRTEEGKALVAIDPASKDRLRALAESGGGCLCFSAHLGNWELLASVISEYMPCSLVTRNQKSFGPYMVECRDRHGVSTLYDHETEPGDILGRLRRGELVGFALDRNLRNTRGVMTDFLGSPAYTPYSPVLFSLKSKAPLVGAFMVRDGAGYRLFVEEPIRTRRLESRASSYRHYTQSVSDTIGKYIREYPDQWFWAHKRWGKPKGRVAC